MVCWTRPLGAAFLIGCLWIVPAAAQPRPMLAARLAALAESSSLYPLASWDSALERIEADRIRVEDCRAAGPCRDILAKPMADLVARFSGLEGQRRLLAVNRHFNAFPYIPDRAGERPSDDWASPLTFLQRSGDCEDYAIAKYLALRLLGVAEEDMAILILRDSARQLDHAVLVVEEGGAPMVLDNLRGLAPLEAYSDFQPLFVLTSQASWRLKSHAPQRLAEAR